MSAFANGEAHAIVAAYWRRAKIVGGVLVALVLVGIVASYYGCQVQTQETSR